MLTGRAGQFTPNSSDQIVIGQRPVSTDRTRLVVIFPLWNLTEVYRTLALNVRSLHLSVSGRTRQNHLGQMN